MYFLFAKKHPFLKDNKYDYKAATAGNINFDLPGENPFDGVSELAIDVIKEMLNPSPANRIGANDILRMEWFKYISESKPASTSEVQIATNQLAQCIFINEKQE